MLKSGERITPDTEALAAYNLVLSGRVTQGLAELKTLIAKDPDNPMLQFSLAYAYEASGSYKIALEYYGKALPGHVDGGLILSNMSGCWIRLKMYRKSLDCSLRAVKLEPENLKYRFNLAMAYEGLKQWQLAFEQYTLYLSGNSENIRAHRFAIKCCSKTSTAQNFREVSSTVEDLCLKALSLRPGQPWIRRKLALVYFMRFDIKKGLRTLI